MNTNEKREMNDIIDVMKKLEEDIGGVEFMCAVMANRVDEIINERTRKEGSEPENLETLLVLLNSQKYIIKGLKSIASRIILTAEAEVKEIEGSSK